jgi:hypothetical protein
MADGWRSRLIAPVYAFGIAFAVALTLGLVLRPDAREVRLEVKGQAAQVKIGALNRVTIIADLGSARVPVPLDERGHANLPDGSLTRVCATLPAEAGWVAVPPAVREGDEVCSPASGVATSGGVVTIEVATWGGVVTIYADLGG